MRCALSIAVVVLQAALLPCSAATSSLVAIDGFGDGSEWTINPGSTAPATPPVITAGQLQLTYDGVGGDANSVFYNTALDITQFSAVFDYQATYTAGGLNPADGFGFVLQNESINALGNSGGDLGVFGGPVNGISDSVAMTISMFLPEGLGVGLNGDKPGFSGYEDPAPVDIEAGNTIRFTVDYDGVDMFVTMRDLVTGDEYATNFAVDIPAVVGSDTAWIGFAGATGGGTTDQVFSNFQYAPIPEPSVALLLGAGLFPLLRRRRR